MRRNLSILFGLIAWFAVVTQFLLMLENRVASVPETLVRFFSFFTILTNLLVAIYFTSQSFQRKNHSAGFINQPGVLTSVTVYITIMGLVYQILLRHIWQPTGLQKIVDELLHSLIPLLVIIYWYFFENKSKVKYRQVFKWLIYPLVYLFYILVRGSFSGFYPYPFVDVRNLGVQKVLINSTWLVILFAVVSLLFVWIGKLFDKKKVLAE
ncbi:MAG: Pr6Pr family membrane protein [Bacteroidota bacterium]|nr:Pr6Pr family membrane protein [Bacteroidota bacterium]